MATVNAKELLATLNSNWGIIKKEYSKINSFDESEVHDFLQGLQGAPVGIQHLTRSFQVSQAIHTIGARLVDQKLANAETVKIYKSVWAIKLTDTCKYCGKKFKYTLMMGTSGVCTKPRCILNHMRDSL